MLTFPFRLLGTVFLALFCASKWVRRAVAAVAVSALFAAAQHPDVFGTAASSGLSLKVLAGLIAG